MLARAPLAVMEHVVVEFPTPEGTVRAVNDVSLEVPEGSITAVVGESGSGKSTLASVLLRMVPPPGEIVRGRVVVDGVDVLGLDAEELRRYRWSRVSMVFQAAQNILNPVRKIREHFVETYRAHADTGEHGDVDRRIRELLEFVRLEPSRVLDAFPHELSGGMKQRVVIALALLLKPKLVVLDEPTTALDVITQHHILQMLRDINRELGTTMLLLSHDIAMVAQVSTYVAIMYAGMIVEYGPTELVFEAQRHPYTRGLIHAAPSLIRPISELRPIPGSPPDLLHPPSGCPFFPRCNVRVERCLAERPPMIGDVSEGAGVACHLFREGAPSVEYGRRGG